MTIITISRGSYSMGRAVAEGVASRLGYECLSRDILIEASEHFNIPEIKLEEAISNAPSILERITEGRKRYIAYIQSALARHAQVDQIVYHGLAGHILLRKLSHVLRVRIIADLELRISVVMERDECSATVARKRVARLDRERLKWTKSLYGLDPTDPSLYDLILNISRFGVKDAVGLICRAAKLGRFASTDATRQQIDDLAVAADLKALMIEKHPDVFVECTYGNVLVYCNAGDRRADRIHGDVRQHVSGMTGVNSFEVHAGVPAPDGAV